MTQIIVLICALAFLACGTEEAEIPLPTEEIAEDLAPYIIEFYNYAAFYGVAYGSSDEPVKVIWKRELGRGPKGGAVLGLCSQRVTGGYYQKKVAGVTYYSEYVEATWDEVYILDQDRWSPYYLETPNKVRSQYLRWVVFHELGHCVLNLSHIDDRSSIMYEKVPMVPPETLDNDWPTMVKSFFEER